MRPAHREGCCPAPPKAALFFPRRWRACPLTAPRCWTAAGTTGRSGRRWLSSRTHWSTGLAAPPHAADRLGPAWPGLAGRCTGCVCPSTVSWCVCTASESTAGTFQGAVLPACVCVLPTELRLAKHRTAPRPTGPTPHRRSTQESVLRVRAASRVELAVWLGNFKRLVLWFWNRRPFKNVWNLLFLKNRPRANGIYFVTRKTFVR